MGSKETPHSQRMRFAFIEFRLLTVGRLNRTEIMDAFKVSQQTASHDIRLFEHQFPNAMVYDKSARTYFPTGTLRPAYLLWFRDWLAVHMPDDKGDEQ